MDFIVSNRPKLPRNRYGWVGNIGGNSTNIKGGSGLDSKTLNSLYDLIDWFYKDGDFVHSKYSFVGDYEVAAYNNGSIIDGGSYNASWIDSSYLYILDLIDQLDLDISIDGSIDLTDFAKRNWVQNNFPDNGSVSATYVKNVSFNSYIETLNSSINQIEKWWWLDGSTINTSFHIVGHGEVNAYGQGPGSETDSYTQQHIDTSYNYIINLIDNISIGGGGEGGTYILDVSIFQWNNAANLAHTHSNKEILDGITDSSVNLWNETAENLNSWFFFDNDTSSVVTPYNLRSQNEITAYNTGDSSDADAYPRDWSDASYQFLMDRINNISINIDISDGSIDLSGLAKKTDLDDVSLRLDNVSSRLDNVSSRVDDLSVFVDTLNTSVNEIEKWWWIDGSTLNTSFHVVGHGEINAYGRGEGAETDSYTQEYIDTQFNNIINMIENISTGGDITIDDISGFVKDVSFNKLVDDVCNGFSEMGADIANVSNRVNDLSIYVDGLNVNINDVSNKLNSWFYIDSSGNLNTSLNLIGHKEIMAWGKGDSSEINLAGYVTSDYLEDNYYNKSDIDRKITEGIDGSIDLSGYVTKIYLENNYPDNASVWDNYVHNASLVGLDVSLSEINTSINDISSRVNTFEGWFYKDESGFIHCSSTFISDYELAAYGMGQQGGEIVLSDYVLNVSLVENYYNKQDISNMIQNVSFDNYPTNSSVFLTYAQKSDLNDYVEKTVYNTAVQEINTSILDISTRLSDVSTRLKSTDSSVKEFSRWFWKDSAGNIHCSANFIGEHEVAAFGAGQGGGEINLQGYAKIADISSSYYNKSEIDQRFDTIELDDYVKVSDFNTSTSEINASIRDLRSRIANVSQNVNNANASISGIKSDILTINNNISNLNAHINDVDNYAVNISTRLKSTNATVDDLSTRMNDVSAYAINISTTLNDWFEFKNGKLYTKYDFISEKEICAYKDGSSGQSIDYSRFVDSSTLNNYYTKSEVNSLVDNKMDSFDLSDYVKNSSLTVNYPKNSSISSNYPKNSSVYNNYVQKTAFNSSYNELRTYISNDYLSTSSFNLIYERLIGRIADVSSKAIKNQSNLYDVSTLLKKTNSSVGRFEEWFELDSAGNVHCKKPFIGNYEVTAYGHGSGSGGGSEIDLAGYVSVATMNSSWVPYFNQKYFYPGKDISTTNDITAGEIYADGDLTTDGHLYAHNDLWVSSSTYLLGNASLNSSLWVKNSVSVGKNLSVSEKTTLKNVSIGSNGNITMDSSKPILKIGKPYGTGEFLNASIIFGDTARGSINVYRKRYTINNNGVYKYDMDIMAANKLELKAVDVSINSKVVSFTDSSILNASLYFGSQARGYINVSTLLDDDELKHDMTIAAGRNIDLKCENINLVADTTVDGGLSVNGAVTATGGVTANGAVTGSGNLQLNSQTSKITIGPTPTSSYNSSIIFGNTGMGYIRSYYNNNKKNLYIKGGDILTLDAGEKISFVKDLTLDTDIVFSDGGNILGAGTIHCEDLIYDSDRRLKKNIRPLEYKGGLNPVEFDMVKDNKHSIGFVAQEVAEKYPQVVHENKDGYLSLDYPKITAVLAAQVNEQNKLISALTERLNQIEKLLNK